MAILKTTDPYGPEQDWVMPRGHVLCGRCERLYDLREKHQCKASEPERISDGHKESSQESRTEKESRAEIKGGYPTGPGVYFGV